MMRGMSDDIKPLFLSLNGPPVWFFQLGGEDTCYMFHDVYQELFRIPGIGLAEAVEVLDASESLFEALHAEPI